MIVALDDHGEEHQFHLRRVEVMRLGFGAPLPYADAPRPSVLPPFPPVSPLRASMQIIDWNQAS